MPSDAAQSAFRPTSRLGAALVVLLLVLAAAIGVVPLTAVPAAAAAATEPVASELAASEAAAGGPAATEAVASEPGVRLAGPDRVATAAALSRHGWQASGTAVLVRADDFADALSAGMLADHLDAPLLLTARDALSPAAEAEVRRLGVRRAVIVGGSDVVGGAVAQRLAALGARVERLAGRERFSTAVAVSEAIEGIAEPEGILIARAAHREAHRAWPDALSGGAFAALDRPVRMLLTADDLPAVTRDRVRAIGSRVTFIGGPSAIPEQQVDTVAGIVRAVYRLAGADRYGTSVAVADDVLGRLGTDPRPLIIASGANYPDALAAAALVGRLQGVLLLVPPTGISPDGEMARWLGANRARFSSLIAVGGADVLGDGVVGQVAAASGTRAPAPDVRELALPRLGTMGPRWQRAFTIGYGAAEELLGTHLIGDGGGLVAGPDSGAQGPDGTWWILDTGKTRVARYDARGRYLDQVVLGPELLRGGMSMPYSMPRVLDDGTFVAFATDMTGEFTDVLRVRGDRAERIVLPGAVTGRSDDGTRIYGHRPDGVPVLIDLDARRVTPVSALRGRDGRPFSVQAGRGQLTVGRPDAGQQRTLPVVAAQAPGGPVGFFTEVATDEQGTLHLLLNGAVLADQRILVGGYTAIRPDGTAAPVEPVVDPYPVTDIGGPAALGVRPGSDEVTLMSVQADGVHVYRRIP